MYMGYRVFHIVFIPFELLTSHEVKHKNVT